MQTPSSQETALWLILIPDIVLTVIAGIAVSMTATGALLGSDSAITSFTTWFSILSVALALCALLNLVGAFMFLASSLKTQPRPSRRMAM